MKIIKSFSISLLFGFIALSTPSTSIAKSSVWKASKNGGHLFLGGTVHFLAADDYPLPCEFDLAYSVSDKLYFETDVEKVQSQELAFELINKGVYPFGEDLSTRLSKTTLAALSDYLNSVGLPSAGFMKYKPGLLMSFITLAELNKLGIQAEGVDVYFSKLAIRDNKSVGYFEEPQEQINFIVNLGVDNEENFINYLVENSKQFENQFLGMREGWRNGEMNVLTDFSEIDDLRTNFPNIFSTLITKRNEQWLTKIDQLILNPEVEYVLVGALHMAEKEGLLARLESKGYQIDQLSCHYK